MCFLSFFFFSEGCFTWFLMCLHVFLVSKGFLGGGGRTETGGVRGMFCAFKSILFLQMFFSSGGSFFFSLQVFLSFFRRSFILQRLFFLKRFFFQGVFFF